VKKSENLQRLHSLVNELGDKDDKLKRDMQLFEEFFDEFPTPVTLWSITRDKTVVSQRGNGFICPKADQLNDLFECSAIKDTSMEKHELALSGQRVNYFIRTEKGTYYVKLIPRLNKVGDVAGVSGISWDMTVNATLLSCLEEINAMTKNKRGAYKEIHEVSGRGIATSRLRKLRCEQGE